MKSIINKKDFGPWALITGASSGIGKEFARQLAAEGINLVLASRRLPLLKEIGDNLHLQYGIKYHAIEADISEDSSFDKIVQITNHLEVGLIVSNAGTGAPGEFIEKRQEDLLKTVHTSVIAHLKISHHFGKRLAQMRRGGIILVSAMGASHGLPFMTNDAGTRAYIRSFGLGLHEELKKVSGKRYGADHLSYRDPYRSGTGLQARKNAYETYFCKAMCQRNTDCL